LKRHVLPGQAPRCQCGGALAEAPSRNLLVDYWLTICGTALFTSRRALDFRRLLFDHSHQRLNLLLLFGNSRSLLLDLAILLFTLAMFFQKLVE
jgi:hypothetical protein